MGVIKKAAGTSACGSYGIAGMNGIKGGYDAILIPGAAKKADSERIVAQCQAGGSKGLISVVAGNAAATVCCK